MFTANGVRTLRRLLTVISMMSGLSAYAHFLVMIPDDAVVEPNEKRRVSLDIQFTHPMEQGPLMHMEKPVQFGVLRNGERVDLREELQGEKEKGIQRFEAEIPLKRPGDHVFYMEPAPYWEPAEGKMIVHYTKVVVNAFGEEDGWDKTVGFPVEIKPLIRPYGLWTGNTFRGVVTRNGEPVPFAEIEVEYWNADKEVEAPAGAFVTQVIKADKNGIFSYTMPREGWWGFAALLEGDKKIKNPEGKDVGVEMGALIWIPVIDMD